MKNITTTVSITICAFLLNSNLAIGASGVPLGASKVYVSGKQLIMQKRLVDGSLASGKPYIIKGVTWNPATRAPVKGLNPNAPAQQIDYGFFFDWDGRNPQGHVVMNYWRKTEFLNHYQQDIALIKEMNVNTVRVYTDFYNDIGINPQVYSQVLDELYDNGIMVIMTVANSRIDDIDNGRYLNIVTLFKDHPAILMWSLGNEWNMGNLYYGYGSVHEAAIATNTAAQNIKSSDPNHPVSSCLGDRFTDSDTNNTISSIIATCPYVDLWGLNIYRGATFGNLFTQWAAITSKPLYVSEFGTDSFYTNPKSNGGYSMASDNVTLAVNCKGREDQTAQANYTLSLWGEIKTNLSAFDSSKLCIGGLVHEFNDELCKAGNYNVGMGSQATFNYNGYDGKPGTADDNQSYGAYNTEGLEIIGGHPDDVGNEEYFGVMNADRQPKEIYNVLKNYYGQLAVDATPPSTPVVKDEGQYTIKPGQLYASWLSSDPESGISEYQYKITKDSIRGVIIRNWTSTGTTAYVTAGALRLARGRTYYFSVKAKNGAGLWSSVGYSNGITVRANVPSATPYR